MVNMGKWKGVGALKEVRGGYGVGLWKTIRKLVKF